MAGLEASRNRLVKRQADRRGLVCASGKPGSVQNTHEDMTVERFMSFPLQLGR